MLDLLRDLIVHIDRLIVTREIKAQLECDLYEAQLARVPPLPADKGEPIEMFRTVKGLIPVGDVPRDENGSVLPEWLAENCTCEEHTEAREAVDKKIGGYL